MRRPSATTIRRAAERRHPGDPFGGDQDVGDDEHRDRDDGGHRTASSV